MWFRLSTQAFSCGRLLLTMGRSRRDSPEYDRGNDHDHHGIRMGMRSNKNDTYTWAEESFETDVFHLPDTVRRVEKTQGEAGPTLRWLNPHRELE